MTLEVTHGKAPVLKDLVRELLRKRLQAVRDNPSLKITDRWTLSSVFYAIRPIALRNGIALKPSSRKTIQNQYVRDICEQELGVRREELGIVAAVRAQLYFRGQVHNVSLSTIKELAGKGTDLLVIEKEGIADILAPFAAQVGIAILNPRGFLTENAEDLSRLARDLGGHISILTDFDASGIVIEKQILGIFRVGVDLDFLSVLGIDAAQVQERCRPSKHWKWLKRTFPYYEHLEYLRTNRIEIDSVNAIVGAERLWEVILAKLTEHFPLRDYNRAVEVPDFTTPEKVNHFTW